MSPRRLRAPAVDGGLLAEPPPSQAATLVAANRTLFARWDARILGQPAHELRREAREAALSLAGIASGHVDPDTPWIVTGHQPELFHPGVWVKSFAVGGMARRLAGFGLHLVVDNDLPKDAAIRVPCVGPDGRLRLVSVPFDLVASEVPFEDWTITDESLFRGFGERVLAQLDDLVDQPLIATFWPRVLRTGAGPFAPGHLFARARREIERDWGLDLPQASLGKLCESRPFSRFACHLLVEAERFRAIHNTALTEYRRRNRIRSKNHPVPELAEQDGWVETPFWIWSRAEARRRPLMARSTGGTIRLRPAGQPPLAVELPLGVGGDPEIAIERLQSLASREIRIRTRALTTTMFARLFLGDVFVHGIGGAKYDELGDEIIRQIFAITPPAYMVMSQTIWLGLNDYPGAEAELRSARAIARDLTYNPDRHVGVGLDPQFDEWRSAKQAAIASPGKTHIERKARWRKFRTYQAEMAPKVAQPLAELRDRMIRLSQETEWNRIAHHRGLSFVLHRADRLRDAFTQAERS